MENKPDKKEIRALVLARRSLIGPGEKAAKDLSIRDRLAALPSFRAAGTLLFYASFKDEADTLVLIEGALQAGKYIILPKVKGPELELFYIKDTVGLQKGFMGIPEPVGDEPRAEIDEADIVIVPGVAFDTSGGRLGYGKGYYDRLLARRARPIPLVAVAYEAQIYGGRLPMASHDIRIDCIVTEERTLRISG